MSPLTIAILAGLVAAIGLALLAARRAPRRKPALAALAGVTGFVVVFAAVWLTLGGDRVSREVAEIEKFRLVRILQEQHPELKERVREAVRKSVERNDGRTARDQFYEITQGYFPRYVPNSSDAAVRSFAARMVTIFEELRRNNPDGCKSLAGGASSVQGYEADSMAAALDAMADVVESAIATPQPPPDPAEVAPLLQEVGARVFSGADPDILPPQQLAQPGTAPADKMCHTMIAFYRAVLALPDREGSLVLRRIMTSSQ